MNRKESTGKALYTAKFVTRVSPCHYRVRSKSRKGLVHDVWITKKRTSCTCEDHKFKKSRCIHIYAVEFMTGLESDPGSGKSVPKIVIDVPEIPCPKCLKTDHVTQKGVRDNMYYSVQMYRCKKCNKKFSGNLGFERIKVSPTIATLALNMYFNGESLRDVADSLSLIGIDVAHKTVLNWITRFIGDIVGYVIKWSPQLSDDWTADEIFIKFLGKMGYVYSLMDERTRYWISLQVANTKKTPNIQALLKDGRRIGKKTPTTLTTDGAQNFHAAWKREYKPKKSGDKKTQHVRHIHFDGDYNTNYIERLNGEIRDREKTMRGLKTRDTAIIPGIQVRHNIIHKHGGLNGKTPAEAAGIVIKGRNKWITVIQNAALDRLKSDLD